MTTEAILDKLEAGTPMRIKAVDDDQLAAVFPDQPFNVRLSDEGGEYPVCVSFSDFTLTMTIKDAEMLLSMLSGVVSEWKSQPASASNEGQ